MANDEQLAILEKGVAAWNMWREENPEVRPRLRGADLSGAKLEGAILSGAILSRADLSGARLVKMPRTDRGTKGIEIGVNGIWSKDTDTAALMTLTPPGNSMLAANPNAVIDSLKHARRLHGLSFGLAVLALGCGTAGVASISTTSSSNEKVNVESWLMPRVIDVSRGI